MRTLLVSACLLGFACKYSGGSNALPPETLAALKARSRLIPGCPEAAGGLRCMPCAMAMGQAAGAAAALALRDGCVPGAVPVPALQALLTAHGAILD